MNWLEFKKQVDKELKEKEIDPNQDIWYIDISLPYDNSINIDEDTNIGISIHD